MRRAISLMEVLISMFILAVGLLGVAALIPAGSAQVNAAAKLDNASMIGRSSVRDLQVRGLLNPAEWRDASGNLVYRSDITTGFPFSQDNGTTYTASPSFVLDPLGVAAGFSAEFPSGADTTKPYLLRIATVHTRNRAVADSVFRSQVDRILTPNDNSDFPPSPLWLKDGTGNASARASDGNYTWLATLCQEPTLNLSKLGTTRTEPVSVSVAVFYKRDLSAAQEFSCNATQTSLGEWDVTLPANHKGVKPGEWIMASGRREYTEPVTGNVYQLRAFRWYQVLAAMTPAGGSQKLTLRGQDWAPEYNLDNQVSLFSGIVSVYERSLPLEF